MKCKRHERHWAHFSTIFIKTCPCMSRLALLTCVNHFLGGMLATAPSGWTVFIFLCFLTASISPCGKWKWQRPPRSPPAQHLPFSQPGNSDNNWSKVCISVWNLQTGKTHVWVTVKKTKKQSVICSDGMRALSECMCFYINIINLQFIIIYAI